MRRKDPSRQGKDVVKILTDWRFGEVIKEIEDGAGAIDSGWNDLGVAISLVSKLSAHATMILQPFGVRCSRAEQGALR